MQTPPPQLAAGAVDIVVVERAREVLEGVHQCRSHCRLARMSWFDVYDGIWPHDWI
jgi:hypothetical protein